MVTFAGTSKTIVNEDLSWVSQRGDLIGGTLDVSAFDATEHYPDDALVSGIAVGLITATSIYGPYDNTAMDGTETFVGFTYGYRVVNTDDLTQNVDIAIMVSGVVDESALPGAGGWTNGGDIDAAGKTDNPRITYI